LWLYGWAWNNGKSSGITDRKTKTDYGKVFN